MRRRRWFVVGLVVLVLATVCAFSVRSASDPPLRFIHGRKMLSLQSRMQPDAFLDYYVFPGSAKSVQGQADEEVVPLGYHRTSDAIWIGTGQNGIDNIEVGDSSTWELKLTDGFEELDCPPGSVIVLVVRHGPSPIERIQQWARRIGL